MERGKRTQVGALGLVLVGLWACGEELPAVEGAPEPEQTELMAFRDDIVDVDQTPSKYQSIGNCWLYATASWAESLHVSSTGTAANLSETYWTYWHWFDAIVSGRASASISTGGTFQTASNIIRRYGFIEEGAFIPSEANSEYSAAQRNALAIINASLASGALMDPAARSDRALVRQELDRAFGLSAEVVAQLDQVFGPSVSRTLSSSEALAAAQGTAIRSAGELSVSYAPAPGAAVATKTLTEAMNEWREVYYDPDFGARAWQKRVQQAMHEKLPVILTWFVDFNSLGEKGRFADVPEAPGRQGFHMTVLEDYEVENVPGFGTLPAGQPETRPEALAASLSDEARLVLLRTKNSWGTYRPDRQFVEGFPGYHDLYFKYLDGPVQQCRQTADGQTDTSDCPWSIAPLVSSIMPRQF